MAARLEDLVNIKISGEQCGSRVKVTLTDGTIIKGITKLSMTITPDSLIKADKELKDIAEPVRQFAERIGNIDFYFLISENWMGHYLCNWFGANNANGKVIYSNIGINQKWVEDSDLAISIAKEDLKMFLANYFN